MSSIVITLKTGLSQAHAKQFFQLETGKPREQALVLSGLFRRAAAGVEAANFEVQTASADPAAASGTITITHANVTANDTTTIGGVVLTAKGGDASGEAQWDIGADADGDAEALADCINGHSTLSKHLVASADSGVVTVTARQKGSIGNLIVMATSDATAFALVQLADGAGGAEEAAVNYALGI